MIFQPGTIVITTRPCDFDRRIIPAGTKGRVITSVEPVTRWCSVSFPGRSPVIVNVQALALWHRPPRTGRLPPYIRLRMAAKIILPNGEKFHYAMDEGIGPTLYQVGRTYKA